MSIQDLYKRFRKSGHNTAEQALHDAKAVYAFGQLGGLMKAGELLISAIEGAGLEMLEIEVESGAFAGADAFRQTGVNTTLLVITK